MIRKLAAVTALICSSLWPAAAPAAETIRIGALKFGTVTWELNTIQAHKFAERRGVTVEIVPFAGEDASGVAFRAGDVDIIVTDWIEVARMRAEGEDTTFAPFSSSTGAFMVAVDSPIKTLADLQGWELAVAGGPLDKGWLLLQGMAKQAGIDLANGNEVTYGAPPLIAEKLRDGEFDAALNYWQFNARLQAEGFRKVVDADDAAKALGADGRVSTLGYVFRETWANERRDSVLAFLAASREAKGLLESSDAEWQRLHEDGAIKDEGALLAALRDGYRDGIPKRSVKEEQADASRLFAVLRQLGGEQLVGTATRLPAGTYWPAWRDAD